MVTILCSYSTLLGDILLSNEQYSRQVLIVYTTVEPPQLSSHRVPCRHQSQWRRGHPRTEQSVRIPGWLQSNE